MSATPRICGFCGDRYDSDTVHACWVLDKIEWQENLAGPVPSNYAPLGRDIEADSDWRTNHGV